MIKKLLFLLLMTASFTACNNNKAPDKKADYRKDDYDKNTDDEDDNKTGKDGRTGDTGEGEWSRADRKTFDQKCLEILNNNESKAKVFCPCFFEKVSKKYSSISEMDEKSTEDEGKRLATLCMDETGLNKTKNDYNDDDNSGGWTKSDENKFVDQCSGTASKNVGEERANQYCNCMLKKMKKEYSSYAEADRALNKMSKEEINQLAAACN